MICPFGEFLVLRMHCSREMCRFNCCWGWNLPPFVWGIFFLCFLLLFPLPGVALHILQISLSSAPLTHIGSVRRQFVVDPSPTHPSFCGGLSQNFICVFAICYFFLFGNFWIRFWITDFEHARPFSLQLTSHAQPPTLFVLQQQILFSPSQQSYLHIRLLPHAVHVCRCVKSECINNREQVDKPPAPKSYSLSLSSSILHSATVMTEITSQHRS